MRFFIIIFFLLKGCLGLPCHKLLMHAAMVFALHGLHQACYREAGASPWSEREDNRSLVVEDI